MMGSRFADEFGINHSPGRNSRFTRRRIGREQSETDKSLTAVRFRAAHVFDISHTDGHELSAIGFVTAARESLHG